MLAIHFGVVLSIAGQPLGVAVAPPEARSWIWPLHNDTVHRAGPGADFFAVMHAGLALQANRDLYATRPLGGVPYFYAFRYLPVVASTLGRVSLELPPHAAWVAWIGVLEVLLAGITAALFLRARGPRLRGAIFALLYLQSPFFLELHMGQFTFAALSLLVLSALLADDPPARRRALGWLRRVGLALCFAVSAALKPIGLAALPAFERRRADAAAIAVALLVLAAITLRYFALHPDQWVSFAGQNLGNPAGSMDSGNYGFTHLTVLALQDLRLLSEGPPPESLLIAWRYGWLALAAALVLTSRSSGVTLGTCALVLAHFLGFAEVWEHHMSAVVVIGAALLVVLSREPGRAAPHAVALTLVALIALALPTPFALFDTARDPHVYHPSDSWPRYALYLCVASKALPTLLLFAVTGRELLRAGWRWPHSAAASEARR